MLISVLLVARNEEKYILNCIVSIESQFENNDDWELIFVDGDSTDATYSVVTDYLAAVEYKYSILRNPNKILASGWNIALRNSSGKFVIRPDAHGALHPGYIRHGLKVLLENDDITAVGGRLETKAKGFIGSVIKEALSLKICVGNSSFRTSLNSGYYDTAVFAIYRSEIFKRVGYFNENLTRHQDTEMHQRISSAGGKLYMNTQMKADYYCRDSLRGIIGQMFNNGIFLPEIIFQGGAKLRHLAPFGFYFSVFGLFFASGASIVFHDAAIGLIGIYAAVIFFNAIYLTLAKRNTGVILIFLIIPIVHFSYFAGTFYGFFKYFFRGFKGKVCK